MKQIEPLSDNSGTWAAAWHGKLRQRAQMKSRSNNQRRFLRQVVGWGGLLFYLGALSPVGIAVAAFLGGIDPDHHLRLEADANGLRLVLHHDGNCAGHHHGTVARALTLLAQPASATDPDHVLQFSSDHGFTRESQLLVPGAKESESIVVHLVEPLLPTASQHDPFTRQPRQPPGAPGQTLCLRSTVLLI